MRGKKAAGAAIRKDRAELEQRAVRAEHAERRLTGELAALRERSGREIHALRTALAEAKRQRDDAASPLLLGAEERVRTLSADLLAARAAHERTKTAYQKLVNGLMLSAHQEGLTIAEARHRIANLSGEEFQLADTGGTEEAPADPQRAAFERAVASKERDATNLIMAAGGRLAVKSDILVERAGGDR
ncbi:hypothetical protein C1I98_11055 [Spongiactinospora gelatinilytica]|uniref:Uncharacterized protein n=1 Tax=Spongiactinospora gelatinilytica TaxID=2666298 RepID=A0A2W2GJY8_9ACTN|nr:hypothetical protein [Spongiactinospora gelatinilytica]PZG49846.1 hypothetical protein C1I98_11055 [Spongiactinospora gelatinilytica]